MSVLLRAKAKRNVHNRSSRNLQGKFKERSLKVVNKIKYFGLFLDNSLIAKSMLELRL